MAGITSGSGQSTELGNYRDVRRLAAIEFTLVHYFLSHRPAHRYVIPDERMMKMSDAAAYVFRNPVRRRTGLNMEQKNA